MRTTTMVFRGRLRLAWLLPRPQEGGQRTATVPGCAKPGYAVESRGSGDEAVAAPRRGQSGHAVAAQVFRGLFTFSRCRARGRAQSAFELWVRLERHAVLNSTIPQARDLVQKRRSRNCGTALQNGLRPENRQQHRDAPEIHRPVIYPLEFPS